MARAAFDVYFSIFFARLSTYSFKAGVMSICLPVIVTSMGPPCQAMKCGIWKILKRSFAPVGRRDFKPCPIFGNGPPRNFNVVFLQPLYDFLVFQRPRGIFLRNHLPDHFPHRDGGEILRLGAVADPR